MKKQNRVEAKKIITDLVMEYGVLTYAELKVWVINNRISTKELKAQSGQLYQVELQAFWDDKPNGDIRLSGSIYDDHVGFLGTVSPVSFDIIKTKI